MKPAKDQTRTKRPNPLPARTRPLRRRTLKARQKRAITRALEPMIRFHLKLMPLVRWYFLGSLLVVMATASLTWLASDVSGQEDLLMLFLAGILMLAFLFCIPMAIMNFLSKDYLFTVAMAVLGYFMIGTHGKVIDTLGTANIQMQAGMVFLGACLGVIMVIYIRNIKTW